MDDIDLIRRLGAEASGPDKATMAQARARLMALAAQTAAIPARRRRQRRAARRWPLALAGAATGAAAALLAMGLLPHGESGAPDSAAAAVLMRAAATAASQPPSAPPRGGQYEYTLSKGVQESDSMNAGPNHDQSFAVVLSVTREAWIGPDGSGRIRETENDPRFPTEADRSAWIAAGRPDLQTSFDNTFAPGGLSYLDLSTVPTDPARLQQLIEQRKLEGGPAGDAETFTIIGDLLRETYAPPALRAALYQIASRLPGVQLVGAVHDQLGRTGTAVAYTSAGFSHQLIFDPHTSALLAEQTLLADPGQAKSTLPAGTVLDWTAYLRSGVVDSTSAVAKQ